MTENTDSTDPLDGELVKFSLACIGLVWYGFLVALSLLGCMSARKRYRVRPRSPSSSAPREAVPGVSILRPLKGLDTNLYENLESTFTQEYANYEILLSVASSDDQALPVVRELITRYPHVNARIIIGEEVVGVNPKVNNLVKSYREAVNDILWVIDSNVWVQPGTMARSVDALTTPTSSGKRVAVVHHVPFAYATESKLGSRVEEAFLNTNHAKMYVAINTVAIESCVVGKSNMYRRSDVNRVNGSLKPIKSTDPTATAEGQCGLAAFGGFLAEDNMIASALWHELGVRHDLSCDVARNVVGNMTMLDYVYRRARWIRVRKHMVLAATLLEPFTESAVLCSIAALSLRYLTGFPILLAVILHIAGWLTIDLDVYSSLAGYPLPAAIRWEFLTGWVVRELAALPIFLYAIFGDTVTWRGREYKVSLNGQVTQTTSQSGFWEGIWRWNRTRKNYEPVQTSSGDV